ncbi:MAG: ATP synthase F1 subunit delta [Pirellulales bacterium]|nr:ATP synthase F1 subunit delta [Pirellulales bacterium]
MSSEATNSAPAESMHADNPDGVAATYAKALLGACLAKNEAAAVVAELDSFVADVWRQLPRLSAILSSGLVAPDEKAALLQKSLGNKASQTFMNFLLVLARHDRLASLPAIQRAVRAQQDQAAGLVRVRVTTADPLEAAQLTQLQQTLTGLLGGKPVLDNHIDPNIIGGLVLRVGDKVFDGSLAMQLDRVRQQMIQRSVHEIQSRRDRFSTAEGN